MRVGIGIIVEAKLKHVHLGGKILCLRKTDTKFTLTKNCFFSKSILFQVGQTTGLWLDLRKSILLAPAKIHLLWKMVLFGPHGCISVALILKNGKNRRVTFGQRSITEATHIGMCFTIY